MLRFEIKLNNGEIRRDTRVLSAVWKSELDVPADSVSLGCVYDREIFENARSLSAYNGGELVFEGQIDELSRYRGETGTVLKISARSAAAVLLDNEAEPLSYRNPTSSLMFRKHLEPLGFTDVEYDQVPIIGIFRIDKGMSQWQALEQFCKVRYGSKLRVSGSGKVYLRGFRNDKKVRFGSGGIEYYSFEENNRRYKLISEIKLKVSGTAGYLSRMENPNPGCQGIKRVRYVNAFAENNSLSTADSIIERGNLESHCVKLIIKGCAPDILGAKAEVNDPDFGNIGDLTVRKIHYTFSKKGEFTTVVLGAADREER